MDKIKIIHEAHKRGLHDGQINFWMGILSEVLEDINGMQRVFEYGALNSKFLEFLEIVYSIKEGKGILMEVDTASKNFYSKISQTISLEAENTIVPNHAFDISFSQEIFSLISDLTSHANFIWDMLSPSGVHYATFGWHSGNPCSAKQLELRRIKGQPFYLYSLDEVVQAFHAKGFEVGVKRLTLPYFMIYDPQITPARYGSISDMISCLQDQKILLSFRKWESENE